MRIITGTCKGIRLKTPRGMAIRPTGDRVKESMFNILGEKVIGAEVLDLFAGTGNLGLEALSRGAGKAVFIDKSPYSIDLIRANVHLTKLAEQAEIYQTDVFKALKKIGQAQRQFDLIFCDPPYNQGIVPLVLKQIDNAAIVKPDGLIIIESSKHEPLTAHFTTLQVKRSEQFGETILSFIEQIQAK